jgi:hypothetical protein
MNANCPSCATMLTYYASDIGSTLTCRACGAQVKASADGLTRMAGGVMRTANPGGIPVSTVPRPSSPSPAPAGEGLAGNSPKYMVYLDWLGWGLGFFYVPGLFFTLMFLLLPQMDDARIARMKLDYAEDNAPYRKKEIEYNQNLFKKGDETRTKQRKYREEEDDLNESFRQLNKEERNLGKDDSRVELEKKRDNLKKKREELDKKRINLDEDVASAQYRSLKDMRADKEKLDKDKEDWIFKKMFLMMDQTNSETSSKSRQVWYLWGLLFATIMLMLGGIGYLSPKQGTWRRVVGAITIAAIVLMIAAKMNGGRSVIIGAGTTIKDREVQTEAMPTYAQADITNLRENHV